MQETGELFALTETHLAGCYEIKAKIHRDERGTFVKVFQAVAFQKYDLACDFQEVFYSQSRKNVLRGLHFQSPPMAHDKLVYCISGRALDAVVDLRRASPTYGEYILTELDAESGNMLYIPAGLAHGFWAMTDMIMAYQVTSSHAPAYDKGILWNSVGIPWPCREPILSERDKKFPRFAEFSSPFVS